MPTAQQILDGLTQIANDWQALASVSILAWTHGNPLGFNATVFSALAVALAAAALRLPKDRVDIAAPPLAVIGALLVAFGWVYRHSLAGSSAAYLYAAPLGLIPCATLSALTGIALIFRGLRSREGSLILAAAGIFCGLFGAFRLGVTIDLALLAGAITLSVASARDDPAHVPQTTDNAGRLGAAH
jgi:hypothetical protein